MVATTPGMGGHVKVLQKGFLCVCEKPTTFSLEKYRFLHVVIESKAKS